MLTSVRNPKVAAAIRLKKRAFRERDRAFLAEGAQAVGEALGRRGGLSALFHTAPDHPLVGAADEAGVGVHHVSPDV
ncbi:MAG TPA: RNA methyltransferase, partial [Actinomycetota bacterium]|nr:RNA methyltransferase [Actinomycetota bacterium]